MVGQLGTRGQVGALRIKDLKDFDSKRMPRPPEVIASIASTLWAEL
jgi:hypothetical protein